MPGRNGVLIFVALLLALVIQTSLVNQILPGARPDFLVAIVTGFGLIGGPVAGAATGAAAGILTDIFSGRLIGLGLLALAVAGGAAGLVGRGFFRENVLVPFAAGAAVSVIYQFLFLLGARAFGVFIPFWNTTAHVLFPSLWYNGLLAGLLFPWIQKSSRWLGDFNNADLQRRRH